MPAIALNSALAFTAISLLLFGFLLVLAGSSVIRIEKVTVASGAWTLFFGLVLVGLGLVFLMPNLYPALSALLVPSSSATSTATPGIAPVLAAPQPPVAAAAQSTATSSPPILADQLPADLPPANASTSELLPQYYPASIGRFSQYNRPRTDVGWNPGLQYELDIPFDGGWTATTQCAIWPQRPDQFQIDANVPNATKVYILLNASLTDRASMGKQLGSIDLVFSNGRILSAPIVLGANIREWALDRQGAAVTTTASSDVREASRAAIYLPPPEDKTVTGIVDMLTIEIPSEYHRASLVTIKIIDMSVDTIGSIDPCINVAAITIEYLR